MEVMVKSEREIHHFRAFGDNFCAASESRQKMPDIAVILLNGVGQVFASEELILGN